MADGANEAGGEPIGEAPEAESWDEEVFVSSREASPTDKGSMRPTGRRGSGRMILAGVLVAGAVSVGAGVSGGDRDAAVSALARFRGDRGLAPLSLDPTLSQLADRHSQRMAQAGGLFHSSDLGRQTEEWASYAENVATGATVAQAHQALESSRSHRDNMLAARFEDVGVGVAQAGGRVWITQVFGDRPAAGGQDPASPRSVPAPAGTDDSVTGVSPAPTFPPIGPTPTTVAPPAVTPIPVAPAIGADPSTPSPDAPATDAAPPVTTAPVAVTPPTLPPTSVAPTPVAPTAVAPTSVAPTAGATAKPSATPAGQSPAISVDPVDVGDVINDALASMGFEPGGAGVDHPQGVETSVEVPEFLRSPGQPTGDQSATAVLLDSLPAGQARSPTSTRVVTATAALAVALAAQAAKQRRVQVLRRRHSRHL
ncbi:MAG: CAP domain-containing protein [Acidimicrobiales bacterium]